MIIVIGAIISLIIVVVIIEGLGLLQLSGYIRIQLYGLFFLDAIRRRYSTLPLRLSEEIVWGSRRVAASNVKLLGPCNNLRWVLRTIRPDRFDQIVDLEPAVDDDAVHQGQEVGVG